MMMMMIMMMIMTMAMERISSFLFSRELVRQQNGVDESLRGKGLTRRFPARLCARLWRRCVHCRFLCLGQPADVKEDGLRHRGNVGSVWRAPPQGDQPTPMFLSVFVIDPIRRDADVHRRARGCESKFQVKVLFIFLKPLK